MRYRFHTLDVFTETRFGGNPLAVVLDAEGIDDESMQKVTREFNLSETVFVLKPDSSQHTAKLRIFTPARELPFAGHPTVGTACLLAGLKSAGKPGKQTLALEEKIGLIKAEVVVGSGESAEAEFVAAKLPEAIVKAPPVERLAEALSLEPKDIGFEGHAPRCYSAGNAHTFVPVASLDPIRRIKPNMQRWSEVFDVKTGAPYIYCRQTERQGSSFHARMMAPNWGIAEDPATGAAAAAFAGVVMEHDKPADGAHAFVIEQGFEMGRPSIIRLGIEVKGVKLAQVRVGGHAVRVSEGTIEI